MTKWLRWLGNVVARLSGGSWYARRSGRRALLHFRGRMDRFKLASRKSVRERLIGDPAIEAAVRAHAEGSKVTVAAAWDRVVRILDAQYESLAAARVATP